MKKKVLSLLVLFLVLLPAFSGCLGDNDDNKEEPQEEEKDRSYLDYYADYDVREFTTIDVATNETTTTDWAIFLRAQGGNGAEHYLATTSKGWIMNLGGEYPTWSEDRGRTWTKYIPPTQPIDFLGEGAIIEAPNGDILANSWYPYTGDKLYSYFYDASEEQWSWFDNQLHAPFYDRAWQCVVPGPINFGGQSYPWASLIVSNYWRNSGMGYVISLDGLTYFPFPDPTSTDYQPMSISFSLENAPDLMWDFVIPHREMNAVPLPGQGGLLLPKYFDNGDNAYLDKNLVWFRHSMPSGYSIPAPHLVIDSTGALHSVGRSGNILTYHMSVDGGRNWDSQEFTWDEKQIDEWEFQADGAHGLAMINMRVEVEEDGESVDKDIIFHIRDYKESLEPDTITLIGQGDADATSGLGNDFRFDFASLAILPDGGVVVAYQDSTDVDPLFAVELEVPYEDFEPPWNEV